MSSVLQRLLHNLNLHSLLPSHRDSMVVVVGLGWCMTVLSLMWLSIYNKEWDITVIQPISSPSLLELFMKALVDIWIDLYLIKFQFLSILCVFSCDQAALWMVFSVRLSVCPSVRLSVCLSVCPSVRLSVCPSVRLSVCHTFLTMFPSSYHHEIFRSYHIGPG